MARYYLESNNMTNEERQAWLATLQIGDTIIVENYNTWTGYSISKYKVKNITKSGRIRLDNDILLDANGRYHKYERWSSINYFILPHDDEAKTMIRLLNSRARVGWMFDNVDIEKLSQEDLDVLRSLLEPALKEVKHNG